MKAAYQSNWLMAVEFYFQGIYWAYLLRVWPLDRIIQLVRHYMRINPIHNQGDLYATADLIGKVIRRSTIPFASRCLVRSLVLYSRFGPGNPDLRLHLGLRPDQSDNKDAGHAWVTFKDLPLFPQDEHICGEYREFLVIESG